MISYTVLVAEDEEVNYFYMEELLGHINDKIRILRAINGKEAIKLALNENIDLVLMDIKMPVYEWLGSHKKDKRSQARPANCCTNCLFYKR